MELNLETGTLKLNSVRGARYTVAPTSVSPRCMHAHDRTLPSEAAWTQVTCSKKQKHFLHKNLLYKAAPVAA